MKPTKELLAERGKTHGDFATNAKISQSLKLFFREQTGYKKLSLVQKESLDMIFLKMSRIVSGQGDIAEHWDDIAGYSSLASLHIAEEKRKFEAQKTKDAENK